MESLNDLNILLYEGLNQIYAKIHDKFTSYAEILEFYLKNTGCFEDSIEKVRELCYDISNQFKSNSCIFNLEEFSKKLEEEIHKQFQLDLNNYEFNPKELMLLEKEIAKKITDNGNRIFILYDEPLSLYLEHKILKASKLDHFFIQKLSNDKELDSYICHSPKSFVCFDYKLERLLNFHQKGCWTVYLTHYLFTSLTFLFKKNPFYQLNKDNLRSLKTHGRFFDFSVFVFHEIKNYFEVIKSVNSRIVGKTSKKNQLEDLLQELNPIRVLVFYRFFFKKLEYLRAKHFNSNERVLFSSYVGSLYLEEDEEDFDFSLNGKFNSILIKLNEKQDTQYLKKLIHKFNEISELNDNIIFVNSLKNLDSFLKRHKMILFLQEFCQSEEVKRINEEFGMNVRLPKCYSVNLTEVLEEKQFKEFLAVNELKLPLIIKYTGPKKEFNHMMITICTEEGIKNYVEFMKNFASDIDLVIQTYVNHGGYVIKIYFANNTGFSYFRPSLPDVCDELLQKFEEYKLGYYRIATDELLSHDFVTFWEKLYKNEKIKELVNMDYMLKISKCFRNFSKTSLFGLDFLYDCVNKEYYLIDCNLFPGYKELLHEFNDILTDHICSLYKESEEKNKTVMDR